MSKKLFVGGLSWGTSEDKLYDTFEQFGQLEEAKIILVYVTISNNGI